MNVAASSDRLNDPHTFSAEAARLQKILKIFAEPETKKAIAEHSFNLAHEVQAIDRLLQKITQLSSTGIVQFPHPKCRAARGV